MVNTEPKVDQKGLYSLGETREYLGISRSSLSRYIKDGKIKTVTHQGTMKTLVPGLEIIKFWRKVI